MGVFTGYVVAGLGALFGIALLAVVFQHGLAQRGFDGGLDTLEAAPREPLEAAASTAFVWALVLTALALLPALALKRPSRQESDPAEAVQHL